MYCFDCKFIRLMLNLVLHITSHEFQLTNYILANLTASKVGHCGEVYFIIENNDINYNQQFQNGNVQ